MAHFAKLDANNVVENVIVVSNDDIKDISGAEIESIGISFCHKLFGENTTWKQTSYNHGFRGNFAGIGMTYMTSVATLGVGSTDIFINTKPYQSWTLGVGTASWYPPANPGNAPVLTTSEKEDGKVYVWNETNYNSNPSTAWVLTAL
jgi:hypothetical protein